MRRNLRSWPRNAGLIWTSSWRGDVNLSREAMREDMRRPGAIIPRDGHYKKIGIT